MKKIIYSMLIALLVLSITGCFTTAKPQVRFSNPDYDTIANLKGYPKPTFTLIKDGITVVSDNSLRSTNGPTGYNEVSEGDYTVECKVELTNGNFVTLTKNFKASNEKKYTVTYVTQGSLDTREIQIQED